MLPCRTGFLSYCPFVVGCSPDSLRLFSAFLSLSCLCFDQSLRRDLILAPTSRAYAYACALHILRNSPVNCTQWMENKKSGFGFRDTRCTSFSSVLFIFWSFLDAGRGPRWQTAERTLGLLVVNVFFYQLRFLSTSTSKPFLLPTYTLPLAGFLAYLLTSVLFFFFELLNFATFVLLFVFRLRLRL